MSHPGRKILSNHSDFAVHFRTKDEVLSDLIADKFDESCEIEPSSDAAERKEGASISPEDDVEPSSVLELIMKGEEETSTPKDATESYMSNSKEHKGLFKSLKLPEQIAKAIEEKISEFSSNRVCIANIRDSLSVSEFENVTENVDLPEESEIMHDSEKALLNNSGINYFGKNWETGHNNEIRLRKLKEGFEEEGKIWKTHSSFTADVESAVDVVENLEQEEEAIVDDKLLYMTQNSNLNNLPTDNFDGNPPEEINVVQRLTPFLSLFSINELEKYVILIILCLFAFPLPSFVRGFCSALLLVNIWTLIMRFMKGVSNIPQSPSSTFIVPNYSESLKVPFILKSKGVWFNEYPRPYDCNFYSVTHTIPVYMEIENSYLKLSRPKGKINKRATFDEPNYKLDFINQRIYDLKNCRILLRPEGILRRRFFNKKYPIVIELGSHSLVKAVRLKELTGEEEEIKIENTFASNVNVPCDSSYGKKYLNLFARCNRQKEEWYRRLKAAVKGQTFNNLEHVNGADINFQNSNLDPEMAEYREYCQYMSKFVGEVEIQEISKYLSKQKSSSKKKKADAPACSEVSTAIKKQENFTSESNSRYKSCENHEAISKSNSEIKWLNAFANRLFFDVFRSKYWYNKIKAILQKKMASVRVPFYVDTLELVDLNLGKEGPRFHRMSQPYLDERGLWFDVDLTFEGLVQLTIQTQLNLTKLHKRLEEDFMKSCEEQHSSLPEQSPKKADPNISSSDQEEDEEEEEEEEPEEDEKEEIVNMVEDDDEDEDEDEDEKLNENIPAEEKEVMNVTQIPGACNETKKTIRRSSNKVFRIVESIVQSRYFKSFAESKYVQRAIARMSSRKLRLILDIKSCVGTVAINLPPPPNDRIWYGFRSMPQILMLPTPKFGEKNIRLYRINQFVERKILQEIKKILVLPNMDDLLLPVSPDDNILSRILTFETQSKDL